MATVQDKGVLQASIRADLADNNAGLISAADVRENMDNAVESIAHIVANSNFNSVNPFQTSVRAAIVGSAQGLFIAESGVQFSSVGGNQEGDNIQLVPYPGNDAVDHNLLANLTIGDVHTQYLNVNGQRQMQGNLGLDNYWLNSEGNDGSNSSSDKGLKFVSVDDNNETLHVGYKTNTQFDYDNSQMRSSKGVAKAWVTFDAHALSDPTPGPIVVNASFNIADIQSTGDGKFVIYFKDSIPLPYVAIGSSNSTTDNSSNVDFDLNTVGVIERATNYVTFVVRNDNGEYVNSKVNDLVIFGLSHDNEQPDSLATTTSAP